MITLWSFTHVCDGGHITNRYSFHRQILTQILVLTAFLLFLCYFYSDINTHDIAVVSIVLLPISGFVPKIYVFLMSHFSQ